MSPSGGIPQGGRYLRRRVRSQPIGGRQAKGERRVFCAGTVEGNNGNKKMLTKLNDDGEGRGGISVRLFTSSRWFGVCKNCDSLNVSVYLFRSPHFS